MRNVLGGGGCAGALEAGMCLVTNEGRAPARTAWPPLRLPRPPVRRQVAGEGAAGERRGLGVGGRRGGRAAGLRPSERGEGASCWHFSDSFLLRSEEGKEGRREGRKRGRRGLSRWKVQAEAPSPCGCTGRRAAPGASGRPGARGDGWGRFACVFVRLPGDREGTCVFGLCTVGSWVCAFMSVP